MEITIAKTAPKASNLSQTLLWFGAAVSIAEILTGALIAPLGFGEGAAAILLGHLIGAVILFLAGMIGARSKLPSIQSTRISFGVYGSYGFSALNILQLTGWTAIMIVNAAKALDSVTAQLFRYQNEALWCVVIGALIAVWVILGVTNLGKLNAVVVGALFLFCLVLGATVFGGRSPAAAAPAGTMTFGGAVELSVVMSLSWLPLIADYTRHVRHEVAGTASSVAGYFFGGAFMFILGLGAAIYAGADDISAILTAAGLGVVALVIVVFSTVTTTFLDVYSAGVSYVNISKNADEKIAALAVCAAGVLCAIFIPISQYENFLYFIGSVFAPLFAILLTDYFILARRRIDSWRLLDWQNTLLWIVGVAGYRFLLAYDSPVGVTLPVMVGIGLLRVAANGGLRRR